MGVIYGSPKGVWEGGTSDWEGMRLNGEHAAKKTPPSVAGNTTHPNLLTFRLPEPDKFDNSGIFQFLSFQL